MNPSDPLSQFPSKGQRRQEQLYYRSGLLWSPRKNGTGHAVLLMSRRCALIAGEAGAGPTDWLNNVEDIGLGKEARARTDRSTSIEAPRRSYENDFRFHRCFDARLASRLAGFRGDRHGHGEGSGWRAIPWRLCPGAEFRDQDHGQRAVRPDGALPDREFAGRPVSAANQGGWLSRRPARGRESRRRSERSL